ncbi:hypothetical protein [Paenibacillus sp. ISL-20]|uniref:hypothetical protein n=1 Tax=Paenibacillus sp. ISL-20 TaxID=2819163 RepID=UPI001BEBE96E|nr:hypothetical protein [Paenibacillus sp. ISL-20]MBT2765787.1 hypothetical protein [Paenibacillus sp. ISL-20]
MLQGVELQKLRLYSAPAGGGLATAALCDSGFYEAVGGLDMWPAAIDAYMHNFRGGSVFLGDLTRKHTDYVPSAASVVMIEQVPQYYKSTSYMQLKKLLQPFFPYVHEKVIDACFGIGIFEDSRVCCIGWQCEFSNCPIAHSATNNTG